MSRVLTNDTLLQFAVEASIGVLPGSPLWRALEPNSIGSYGATITTTPRRPISKDRGRKKGVTTDSDSTPEFVSDLTVDAHSDFVEGFMFSEFVNVEFDLKEVTLPPPATATGYDIDAASALLAGKVQWVVGAGITLVYGKGYALAANNGLKPLTADLAPAGVEITVAGNAIETPPTKASLEVAGIRASAADLTLTVSGSTATLVSAADIDWTTTGIQVGQEVHIGSNDGTGAVTNAFQDSAANDTFGYARVTILTATTLTLDKLDENLGAGGSPYNAGVQDVMYGRFARNVATTEDSDDSRYLSRSYQIEASYPELGGTGVTEYEYAIGNQSNEVAISIPLTDKSVINWGFIGTNVDDITVTRKTGAATAVFPLRNVAFGTASSIAALTTDVVSAVSDVCFKSLTLTIGNGLTAEKCIGTLGALFINTGQFTVDIEGQMLFTRKEIVNAVKNNTTVTFQTIVYNEDGAISWDLPTLTLGDGSREFPVDQSVLVNLSGMTFTDPTLGHDMGVSLFANVPTVRP